MEENLENLLVSPKAKNMITKKSSVIYTGIDVTRLNVRMKSRALGERYKEHLKKPSLIFEHQITKGAHAT